MIFLQPNLSKYRPGFLFMTALYAALTSQANAGIGGIGNATVNKGQFTVHTRASLSEDDDSVRSDGRFRSRLMLDYGFTDDFAFGIYIQGDDPGGDNNELDSIIADARVELADVNTHGYYSGFRLRYTMQDGDKKPDHAHVRFIAGMPVNNWDMRINQIFHYQIGAETHGGVAVDTRLQTSYTYRPGHRAGIESFSNFGYGSSKTGLDEQQHNIGPIFAGKILPNMMYEAGYRYGISEAAPDHLVKLFLVFTF